MDWKWIYNTKFSWIFEIVIDKIDSIHMCIFGAF